MTNFFFLGLLYKAGGIEDAITLMKKAIRINDKDPESNFFMANLFSAKGNYSQAYHHYKQTLKMKPDYDAALQFMHVPACELRYSVLKI